MKLTHEEIEVYREMDRVAHRNKRQCMLNINEDVGIGPPLNVVSSEEDYEFEIIYDNNIENENVGIEDENIGFENEHVDVDNGSVDIDNDNPLIEYEGIDNDNGTKRTKST